ncbi:hypothetical protein GCM10009839_16010 [Catenulispora yoronensis]|uniref:Uncharacterized protein n=1 Tax=Catenulispora yoronensis TaxID=450799 RepID=A0ABN2TTW4_9ACTN
MSRRVDLDRRTRASLGAAVMTVGVLLLVLGWYLISGEAIAAKQLPYLASASIPGGVLVVCGFVLALSGIGTVDPGTARRVAELHALLTEAVTEPVTEPVAESVAEPVTGPADKAEE